MRAAPMEPHSKTSNRFLAGTCDALLVFFPVLGAVQGLSLPSISDSSGIVSATTRAGFEPLTNYVQFGLCAIATWTAFALGYRRGRALVAAIPAQLLAYSGTSAARRAIFALLAAMAIAIYLVNITSFSIVGPVEDGFHEGEYLGFIPSLEKEGGRAIMSSLTVHGPGVDFIPGAVAIHFADAEHRIVAARFAYAMLHVGAVLAALFVIAIAVRMLWPEASTPARLGRTVIAFLAFTAMLQVGDWITVPVFHRSLNPRDLGYLLQVGVVLAFATAQARARGGALPIVLAIAAGVSVPLAIAYSYDRGLYGVFMIGVSSAVIALAGGSATRRWFGGLFVGAAAGLAIMLAVFGRSGIAAMLDQVAFWMKYGRTIWSLPGLTVEPHSLSAVLLAGALISIAIGAAYIVRSIDSTRDVRVAFREQIGMGCLLAASLPAVRIAVERGDPGHVAWGVTVSWILLSVLAARAVTPAFEGARDDAGSEIMRLAVSLLFGWCLVQLWPGAAYERVRSLQAGLHKSDSEILTPGQSEVTRVLRAEDRSNRCFYTLTNEGFTYYLAAKPSCSRFYQVTNARTPVAQQQVIAELDLASPSLILFSDAAWSNVQDGVSLFNANPEVVRYVMQHYAPSKAIGEYWLWKRTHDAPRFSGVSSGNVTEDAKEASRGADVVIRGTYGVNFGEAPPAALFVTDGADNLPVWTGRPAPEAFAGRLWSATVPTASLSHGTHRLRIWALKPGGERVQLGRDVDIVVR